MLQPFFPTLVLRHKKENLKKCSLRGLEMRQDFRFFAYPCHEPLPNLDPYILLTLDAPPLSPADAHHGLLLVDATWRYAEKMLIFLSKEAPHICKRSLPAHYRTAYPREQTDCPDPDAGLASIEALYLSYRILGWDTAGLLDNYYWRESFLQKNGL